MFTDCVQICIHISTGDAWIFVSTRPRMHLYRYVEDHWLHILARIVILVISVFELSALDNS